MAQSTTTEFNMMIRHQSKDDKGWLESAPQGKKTEWD